MEEQLRGAVEELVEKYGERIVAVGLFGSYARGEHGERSDVDVLVIVDGWEAGAGRRFRIYDVLSRHVRRDVTLIDVDLEDALALLKGELHLTYTMLNILYDCKILHDPRGILERLTREVAKLVSMQGMERYRVGKAYGWRRAGDLAVKMDPSREVAYRKMLATSYLEESRKAFGRGDWRGAVAHAQLAAENAAKAVISLYGVPSWSHDPSWELIEASSSLPGELRGYARRLADIAHKLFPEHARSTYGDPVKGVPPWEIYSRRDAERALRMAEEAVSLMATILERVGE